MISVDQAKRIIKKCIPSGRTQKIPFDQTLGRILAVDVTAPFPQPRFDNSAMDGYAVKWVDIQSASRDHPITLKSVGVIPAGEPLASIIQSGQCVQIMTGGKIPEGADTVVKVEDTNGFGTNQVLFYQSSALGQHIRKTGDELPKGEFLCKQGTVISAAEIGIFATFGMNEVEVFRQPRVAVFGLGDELIEPGQPIEDGKIFNSNLHVLKVLLQQSGAKISFSSLLKDDPVEIETFLRQALNESDIILSSGGISMGRFDYTKDIFEKLGIIEHFWKVAQKPGKPLFFGTLNEKMIFGLPGNPVSTIIGFYEYVYPVLLKMAGRTSGLKVKVPLVGDFPVERDKHRFLFGTCYLSNGRLVCGATNRIGSHMLTSFLNSNCIIDVPPSENMILEGDQVDVSFLPHCKLEDLNSE